MAVSSKTKAMGEVSASIIPASMNATPHGSGVQIKKTDQDEQIVFGEVFAPGFPDSQGDFMTKETIRAMAYDFMQNQRISKIDVSHSQSECGAHVVESFIARDDDPIFIPGSWVLGVWVPNDTWALIKSGDINGFSLDGMGVRAPQALTYEMPEILKGETDEGSDGHRHAFLVKFDEAGNFLGGMTTEAADGHSHNILRGTVTEVMSGHSHRFSFVEGVLNAQN